MWHKERYYLMGTFIDIQIEHDDGEKLLRQCYQQLQVFNQRFSANDPTSELMQLNQHAGNHPVSVHSELYALIAYGRTASLLENSSLNIAIGPVVKLWGIGFDHVKKPSEEELALALTKTNPACIQLLTDNRVFLPIAGMELDLGALAKGYFADLLKQFLVGQTVKNGLINLGGNVLVWGTPHNKKSWHIGIQRPFNKKESYAAIASICEQSIVTSGIYERTFIYENKQYHHIFDSKTGYPIATDIASLTVVCDQSLTAERWTTQLFGLLPEEIVNIANHESGLEVFVITKQQDCYYSAGFPFI